MAATSVLGHQAWWIHPSPKSRRRRRRKRTHIIILDLRWFRNLSYASVMSFITSFIDSLCPALRSYALNSCICFVATLPTREIHTSCKLCWVPIDSSALSSTTYDAPSTQPPILVVKEEVVLQLSGDHSKAACHSYDWFSWATTENLRIAVTQVSSVAIGSGFVFSNGWYGR